MDETSVMLMSIQCLKVLLSVQAPAQHDKVTQSTECRKESRLHCSSSLFLNLECLSSWKANADVHCGFGSGMVVILFQPPTHDEQSELPSCSVECRAVAKAQVNNKL